MATLNLGRIKPVFRGAYSGSTAYVVDDIVTHGNESFICIQAHGAGTQATSVTAYWTKLAAKGTDGTDLTSTLTTQGDVVYRDGSGLARLGFGTSGHVLTTKGTGANPVWEAASGGKVLQYVRSIWNSNNTTTSTSMTDVHADAKVVITPVSNTSKIFVYPFVLFWSNSTSGNASVTFERSVTAGGSVYEFNAGGYGLFHTWGTSPHVGAGLFYDDFSTNDPTSRAGKSLTYKLRFKNDGQTTTVGRGTTDYQQLLALEME